MKISKEDNIRAGHKNYIVRVPKSDLANIGERKLESGLILIEDRTMDVKDKLHPKAEVISHELKGLTIFFNHNVIKGDIAGDGSLNYHKTEYYVSDDAEYWYLTVPKELTYGYIDNNSKVILFSEYVIVRGIDKKDDKVGSIYLAHDEKRKFKGILGVVEYLPIESDFGVGLGDTVIFT